MNKSLPTRKLREHPDLDQAKRQAKELLDAFLVGEPADVAEVNTHYRDANPSAFALHDAQFVLARAYGFDSWPKLKAYIDGVTVARLAEAVRANDLDKVRAMLKLRPELVNLHMAEEDEHQALHYAVYGRLPEMVRLLMQRGANARIGIYPHRDATTALTIATERGYNDIVAILLEEEQRRPDAKRASFQESAWPDGLKHAARRGDEAGMIAFLEADPAPIHVPYYAMTPLHTAAVMLWERLLVWLLDHGAGINARDGNGPSPLEIVGCNRQPGNNSAERVATNRRDSAQPGRRDDSTAEPYLRQIAWREFSYHLLVHFPLIPREPLRLEFLAFPWRTDAAGLEAWTRGRTGYPLVDAGMRELWRTGWMHNRVRMVAASFLVMHLMIFWEEGAAWFWDTLVDADLANNTMGWQWSAGCGADAAPYFRIFNPMLQREKFDADGAYVRRWLPDARKDYPAPIVEHSFARKRALAALAKTRDSILNS